MEQMKQEQRAGASNLLTVEQLKSAWMRSEPVEFGDPILAHQRLDLCAMFYPMGFPVTVATNSEAVLDAAWDGWGRFTPTFNTTPVVLKVAVAEGGPQPCPPTPVCRMRDHIITNIADSQNWAITDLSRLVSTIWVTGETAEHRDYFRYFFLDSAAMGCISSAHATAIHAGCVALDNDAVLLCGESGAGKTTLSYACAQAGWNYVTDDGSYLVHGEDGRLIAGNCHQVRFRPSAEALFPHIRGHNVMQRAGVGKPSIELQIDASSSIQASPTAKARYMVFLARNSEKEELADFPRAVARMYLWQTVQCVPYQTARHLAAIDALLEVQTFELRYKSLEWAEERLRQLVREGR